MLLAQQALINDKTYSTSFCNVRSKRYDFSFEIWYTANQETNRVPHKTTQNCFLDIFLTILWVFNWKLRVKSILSFMVLSHQTQKCILEPFITFLEGSLAHIWSVQNCIQLLTTFSRTNLSYKFFKTVDSCLIIQKHIAEIYHWWKRTKQKCTFNYSQLHYVPVLRINSWNILNTH